MRHIIEHSSSNEAEKWPGASSFEQLRRDLASPALDYLVLRTPGDGCENVMMANEDPVETVQAKDVEVPIVVQLCLRSHRGGYSEKAKDSSRTLRAPSAVLRRVPHGSKVQWSVLYLSAFVYVPHGTSLHVATRDILLPELLKQIDAAELEFQASGPLQVLRTLHFRPPGLEHVVTTTYSLAIDCTEEEESKLHDRRLSLHRLLRLPTDRPLLRSANSLSFHDSEQAGTGVIDVALKNDGTGKNLVSKRLMNVHLGIPPSGVKGGTVHLIEGDYDYCHYMQDKFDDSGWGCAYRSLQTICSWFYRQHYTTKKPPSHREIQSTLIGLGDKGGEFLGSRQWIGAIELGYVLDAYLGVQSKILTVSSGSEMPSKAREIAAHFDSQGEIRKKRKKYPQGPLL